MERDGKDKNWNKNLIRKMLLKSSNNLDGTKNIGKFLLIN
jgi:hypothetical protein